MGEPRTAEEWRHKYDLAKQQIQQMRDQYYREIFQLREQLHQKNKAVANGLSWWPECATYFEPTDFITEELKTVLDQKRSLLEQQFETNLRKLELQHSARLKAFNEQLLTTMMLLRRNEQLLERMMRRHGYAGDHQVTVALGRPRVELKQVVTEVTRMLSEAEARAQEQLKVQIQEYMQAQERIAEDETQALPQLDGSDVFFSHLGEKYGAARAAQFRLFENWELGKVIATLPVTILKDKAVAATISPSDLSGLTDSTALAECLREPEPSDTGVVAEIGIQATPELEDAVTQTTRTFIDVAVQCVGDEFTTSDSLPARQRSSTRHSLTTRTDASRFATERYQDVLGRVESALCLMESFMSELFPFGMVEEHTSCSGDSRKVFKCVTHMITTFKDILSEADDMKNCPSQPMPVLRAMEAKKTKLVNSPWSFGDASEESPSQTAHCVNDDPSLAAPGVHLFPDGTGFTFPTALHQRFPAQKRKPPTGGGVNTRRLSRSGIQGRTALATDVVHEKNTTVVEPAPEAMPKDSLTLDTEQVGEGCKKVSKVTLDALLADVDTNIQAGMEVESCSSTSARNSPTSELRDSCQLDAQGLARVLCATSAIPSGTTGVEGSTGTTGVVSALATHARVLHENRRRCNTRDGDLAQQTILSWSELEPALAVSSNLASHAVLGRYAAEQTLPKVDVLLRSTPSPTSARRRYKDDCSNDPQLTCCLKEDSGTSSCDHRIPQTNVLPATDERPTASTPAGKEREVKGRPHQFSTDEVPAAKELRRNRIHAAVDGSPQSAKVIASPRSVELAPLARPKRDLKDPRCFNSTGFRSARRGSTGNENDESHPRDRSFLRGV